MNVTQHQTRGRPPALGEHAERGIGARVTACPGAETELPTGQPPLLPLTSLSQLLATWTMTFPVSNTVSCCLMPLHKLLPSLWTFFSSDFAKLRPVNSPDLAQALLLQGNGNTVRFASIKSTTCNRAVMVNFTVSLATGCHTKNYYGVCLGGCLR